MNELPLEEYKGVCLNHIQNLQQKITQTGELKYVLNNAWFNRARTVVKSMDKKPAITDGASYLFFEFVRKISPKWLDERMSIVKSTALKQKKLRLYRKTRAELSSKQPNQILGSLFELISLSAIIEACSCTHLFPIIGPKGRDVEARIDVDGRWVYIEAKALGYSNYDPIVPFSGYVGTHSNSSMIRQVHDALKEKLCKDKYLAHVAETDPTVLLLALGFNAFTGSCKLAIQDFYHEVCSNISCVLVFESSLCKTAPIAQHNERSSCQLSKNEATFFETELFQKLRESRTT